jgi:hypothetical protein
MSKTRPPRLPKQILSELEDLPWSFVNGGKHFKYYIGTEFAFIWPKNGGCEAPIRAQRNVLAQIRRIKSGRRIAA